MRHGSLFSGIGGFDYAADKMGWENVFHCEKDAFCQKVLNYHFPKSIQYEDITVTDFRRHRNKIDILTGGFPCQPYSAAGKRLGKEDDRHLWPEMLRAIREIQPTWVVGENVFGLINWNGGLVFDEVQADLEAEGYEVQPYVLPACAINAPYRRDRVWFIAYSKGFRARRLRNKIEEEGAQNSNELFGIKYRVSNSKRTYANANSKRNTSSSTSSKVKRKRGYNIEATRKREVGSERFNGFSGLQRDVANSTIFRQSQINGKGKPGQYIKKGETSNWNNFPTQPPICSGNDGFSNGLDGITFPKWRNESIKAYGNAIVPQVAIQIFKAIISYNDMDNNV